jgi:type I restriction enzyme M protein
MSTSQDIVARLWNLCHVLRDDGITYHQYVTELSFLLFLKMAKETGAEEQLPAGYRWDDLRRQEGIDQLAFYRSLLVHLGNEGSDRVQAIFHDANTALRQPRNLARLVESIDALDWYSAREEGLGDLYEGLLEKNASEKKSGAGQYFTPRTLIECMVNCIQPQPGEIIQDPAAGTGGFLIMADRYIKQHTNDFFDLLARAQEFQRKQAFVGIELVPDTHRLLLMNAMLHGIESDMLLGDTLASLGAQLPKADVILTNPPFGTKRGGGWPKRDDFTYTTVNKQLAFLQHVYLALKPGGRAGVVVPDNVLFEDGMGTKIRADLMDKCNLHTILRLPTGIFYAQGVKTNVLFFTRGATNTGNTQKIWIYDLRINMPTFGKRTLLTHEHFAAFEACYGSKSDGTSERVDQSEGGRFRCFTRQEIARRGDNLDISWLKGDDTNPVDDLPEPEEITALIRERLQIAMEEMDALSVLLEGEEVET